MHAFHRILQLGALAAAMPALAHEPGEFILRAGATLVEPQGESDNLALDGQPLSLGGVHAGLGVDDDLQLGIAVAYQLNRSFSVELLGATPFRHTVSGTGALQDLELARVRQLPPTLSVLYHFPETGGLLPYVGAGVNYTGFFDEDLTTAGAAALEGLGLRGGRVKADDSWGLAMQLGVDYHLTPRLLLNAAIRRIDIDTKVTLSFADGAQLSTNLDIDPFVYSLGLGLVF